MEFVRSSIQILEDYGLDGLDIDYEASSSNQCLFSALTLNLNDAYPISILVMKTKREATSSYYAS